MRYSPSSNSTSEATRRKLPASGESISIPEYAVLLGTMNTADKSIRSLDSALRRRFAFIELMPDPSVLEGGWSTASIFRFC